MSSTVLCNTYSTVIAHKTGITLAGSDTSSAARAALRHTAVRAQLRTAVTVPYQHLTQPGKSSQGWPKVSELEITLFSKSEIDALTVD